MNYFAHGRRFIDEPYVLAGTAVPDWLSVVNRRVRARARLAEPLVDDDDSVVASIARGVVQHHHDDAWFHGTRAFMELNLQFTVAIREVLPEPGFRPSFVGHILVELLLDSVLVEQQPDRLDAYYDAIDRIDVEAVSHAVNKMTTQPTGMLPFFIPRFSAARFLYDYTEDGKLLFRLNNVMRRVGLAQMPATVADVFPDARRQVRERASELLAGESAS